VIPLGAVEVRALEGVETGEVLPIGMVQHPGGGNDDIRSVFASLTGPNLPAAVNEFAGRNLFLKADAVYNGVFLSNILEISPNLRTRSKHLTPVRVGLKRIGIRMRWYVAGQARIGVRPPGTAQGV